MGHKVQYIE